MSGQVLENRAGGGGRRQLSLLPKHGHAAALPLAEWPRAEVRAWGWTRTRPKPKHAEVIANKVQIFYSLAVVLSFLLACVRVCVEERQQHSTGFIISRKWGQAMTRTVYTSENVRDGTKVCVSLCRVHVCLWVIVCVLVCVCACVSVLLCVSMCVCVCYWMSQ